MIHVYSMHGDTSHEIVQEMEKRLTGKRVEIQHLTMSYDPKYKRMEAIMIYKEGWK